MFRSLDPAVLRNGGSEMTQRDCPMANVPLKSSCQIKSHLTSSDFVFQQRILCSEVSEFQITLAS